MKTMNRNNIKEFALYVLVGGIATVTEWAAFFLLDLIGVYYLAAVTVSYVISTFVNWLAGRLLVFKARNTSVGREILSVYLASIIGLLLNLLIMWIAVDVLKSSEMPSKVAATGLVFAYNFIIRKCLIYKKEGK